ncbi:3-carboxy-cis,cis-muconate cycloisomerase [Streptomyces reniochalinae]|uniref:3-carboxy-cis,cis-muconate cycloisomerase n=1 Tax=Streptomyces reniochalinae TaxID=2250578 RepID=UPI001FE32ED8|nr:3-carboxy-cis,cis-muconate cycloisomerase [Streptomyces reniochalinae]
MLSPVRAGSPAESATGDRAFLQALLDAEAALTRAQAGLGLAPGEAARAVTAAADAAHFDVRDLALRASAGGNPVIPLVADLTAAVGDAAGPWVHRGATSQDIMDTAAMLVAHRTLGHLLADLERTAVALAALAATHRDTAMPGRTLTQHAVPTTFGLKAAGWRALALDARRRLASVREALPVQLGGAAGTLAAFAADGGGEAALRLPSLLAEETGLAEPPLPWHTLRTPVADLAAALAHTAGSLGKLAADVLALTRTETAEVAEGAGGGSSAMPHKANPVRATLVASAARQLPALAGVLFGALAAEDERPAGAWHAEWQTLREALRLTGGAARCAAELAEGLRVRPARMRENLALTGGRLVSERAALVLSRYVGRARAGALVTEAAARSASEQAPFVDVLRECGELADVPQEVWADLAEPARHTGCAPALVDRALAHGPPAPSPTAPRSEETP